MPAWIPGSYMMREFARNIVQIRAEAGGKEVALRKLDKHSWQAAACNGPLTVHYEVYAWDLSVRAAHLDQTPRLFQRQQRVPARGWARGRAAHRRDSASGRRCLYGLARCDQLARS